MPFLETLVIPKPDGSFTTTMYRTPTHTDLYMQWDSYHTIATKYSVVNTLHHRAGAVCCNPQLLKKEEQHPLRVPNRKQVPCMGSEQGENENQCTLQPRPKLKGQQDLYQCYIKQSEVLYGTSICQRAK